MNVTACLVTRGDVDMFPILDSLNDLDEVLVWDNSKREDLAVYGRYALIAEARNDVIFVQDDDAILQSASVRAIIHAYRPGSVTCNMPPAFRHDFYADHALVGFGACFHRGLPGEAFERFKEWQLQTQGIALRETSDWFQRTCDIVFTALTPRVLVDVPYRDREFASAPGRMWTTPGHVEERQRMLDLALRC